MKNLFFIFLFLNALYYAQNNIVTIGGRTNINTFKCQNSDFPATVSLSEHNLQDITLKTKLFRCDNKVMTSDFRKILDAENHPNIPIRILKLSKTNNRQYSGTFEIKLAGKTQTYTSLFTLQGNLLKGSQTVRFSDFGLNPPKKFAGAVVVKNDLHISFSFNTVP